MNRDDRDTLIIFMFEAGLAPSTIDGRLQLAEGTACNVISEWWSMQEADGRGRWIRRD